MHSKYTLNVGERLYVAIFDFTNHERELKILLHTFPLSGTLDRQRGRN